MTWIYLLALFSLAAAGSCPSQGGVYVICQAPAIYVADTTKDVSSSIVNWQFQWLRDHIIPNTAWDHDQQVAFMSYGSGIVFTTPPTSNRTYACTSLDSLTNAYNQEGSSTVTLLQVLKSITTNYGSSNIVLFTAATDPNDISQSAAYVKSSMITYNVTIVSLSSGSFSSFPATIYNVPNINNLPPNLESCIIQSSCGTNECNPNSNPDTTIPPYEDPYHCRSQLATSWNDIVFVLDGSDGSDTLIDLWEMVQSVLTGFNVQTLDYNKTNMVTHVGFVGYKDTSASLVATLGKWNGDDIQNMFTMPFDPVDGAVTDIYDGLQVAMSELSSQRHRPSARKVIVLMSTSYNERGVHAPIELANEFKKSNGILIVWDYVVNLARPSPQLQPLSSPGYYFTSTNTTYTDLQQGILDANCFCQTDMPSYSYSTPRQTPTGGCYFITDTVAHFPPANQRCGSQFQGIVAKGESPSKMEWLGAEFNAMTAYWIGLVYTSNGWMWSDGTSLGSYQPWLNGNVPPGTDGKACVYVPVTQDQWVPVYCTGSQAPSFRYACQLAPCDSTRYCS